MTTRTTPALWHLVGVYFNQDWFEDYPDENAALDAFVAESGDLVALLPGEIEWVLDTYPTESELEDYLESQGSEYLPSAAIGYRGWLSQVVDRVRQTTGQR